MAELSCFINDGYTLTRTVPAEPGRHPKAVIVYRPALYVERELLHKAREGKEPRAIADHLADLIARHVVSVNGVKVDKTNAGRLHPDLQLKAAELVLMYEPSDDGAPAPEDAAGN